MADGPEVTTCPEVKDDGERCAVHWGLCASCGKCYSHCGHREEDRKRAQRRGGQTTAKKRRKNKRRYVDPEEAPPPPETIDDAVTWASWATYAVATGQLDTKTAHQVGYLLNALQRALEKVDMADRVEELKEKLEALERRQQMRGSA